MVVRIIIGIYNIRDVIRVVNHRDADNSKAYQSKVRLFGNTLQSLMHPWMLGARGNVFNCL